MNQQSMKAIVYDAPRKFEYRDVEIPKIQPNEILLRVRACGVCGTDVHVHDGDFGPRFPLIPGHEFSGEIVELGSEVTSFEKRPASHGEHHNGLRGFSPFRNSA